MSERRELDLSEHYSKSKKAALLYSSLLVLLDFAAVASAKTSFTWSEVSLSLTIAKWMAATPAAFYTLTFYLEWRIHNWKFNQLMAANAATSLDTRLKNLCEHLGSRSGELQLIFKRVKAATDHVVSTLNGIRPDSFDLVRPNEPFTTEHVAKHFVTKMAESPKGDEEKIAIEALTQIEHQLPLRLKRLDAFGELIAQKMAEFEHVFMELGEREGRFLREITEMNKKFYKMAGAFSREQKIIFKYIDRNITLGLFAIATVSAIWPGIPAALTRAADFLARLVYHVSL